MPGKTKAPDKRSYERDQPVSLRPLDLPTALAALLKVKPSPPEKPAQKSVSPATAKSRPARERHKD